jgi:peptidoglycan/LPS O-acetylase OafA/YrhL
MSPTTLAQDRSEGAPGGSGRILELDGLRGMAIVLVLLFHYVSIVQGPANRAVALFQRAVEIGWTGVDLFFVLSGFLIGGILLNARRSEHYFKTFYARRIYRIFPIYYLWIAAYFLLMYLASPHILEKLGIVHDKWAAAAVLVLFLQNSVTMTPALVTIWFFQVWSLAVEEQFYLVIPWLVRWLSDRKLVFTLVSLLFVAPLSRVLLKVYLPDNYWRPHLLTFCRSDELAVGVLLAFFWRQEYWRARISSYKKALYAVVGMLTLGMIYLDAFKVSDLAQCAWGYSCVSLFYASLVLLALVARGGMWAAFCRWSVLRNIGAVSYCMYIIHAVVNRVCHVLLKSSDGIATRRSLAATILACGMTWLIAKISWRVLEAPLMRRGHTYQY